MALFLIIYEKIVFFVSFLYKKFSRQNVKTPSLFSVKMCEKNSLRLCEGGNTALSEKRSLAKTSSKNSLRLCGFARGEIRL